MKVPSIAPLIAVALTVVAAAGCSASGKPTDSILQKAVEAGLEAKLEILSDEQNLARIERITDAILASDATRDLARTLAEGAVLGLSNAARDEALDAAARGVADAAAAALASDGGGGLDADLAALVEDAAAAAAAGVLDDGVRARADRFAADLSRTVAAALAEETAGRLPAILDASYRQVSPRLGETLSRDLAPALAVALTGELAPALAASLEQTLGPALEALLADRLLPVVQRAASEQLPPLLRDSTREAMLGLGDALDGGLGQQARAFFASLVDDSGQRLGAAVGPKTSVLGAAIAGLLAAILASACFWRRARDHRRRLRARESALFLLANTINRLPADIQTRVKSAVGDAGRKAGEGRTGGAELRSFLDRYNL